MYRQGHFAAIRLSCRLGFVERSPGFLLWSLCGFPALFFVGHEIGAGEGFHVDMTDAMARHLGDGVSPAIVLDALTGGGNVSEFGEEEAGEGFDAGLAGKLPMKLIAEIAERGSAVEGHDAGGVGECGAVMSNSSIKRRQRAVPGRLPR